MKKKLFTLVVLPFLLILTACSAIQLPGASNSTSEAQKNDPVESKLGIGILKLEGTSNAVTAEQATAMLPLWKGIKAMSSGSNTSTQEMNALYRQIQETLTADQVQAIKDIQVTPDDMQTLMKQYNVQMVQNNQSGAPSGFAPGSSSSARSGSSSSGGGMPGGGGMPSGGMPSGGMPSGGMPGGDMGGGMMGGANSGAKTTQAAPSGSRPSGGPGGGFGNATNNLFADAVIKLLQERAAGK